MSERLRNKDNVTFIPFPDNPKTIQVGQYEVFEYLSPEVVEKYIQQLAESVDFEEFEGVLVNLKGGLFLSKKLASIKGYTTPPIPIEYHRPKKGFGAIVITPVPEDMVGKKALVIDDISDSGGVFREILEKLHPSSVPVALVTKNGIENQIIIPNIQIGVKIDNVWIGGCGMDLGIDGEENLFRNHPGIVVKKD